MKKKLLKIAGVKDEKAFYKLYKDKQAFIKAFPKESNKLGMGGNLQQNPNINYLADGGPVYGGIPGLQGGQPLVNGQVQGAGNTGGGGAGMGVAQVGSAVGGLGANIWDSETTNADGTQSMGNAIGSGALSGAAKGASMGMIAGPWGAAIGGAAGAIGGGVMSGMEANKTNEAVLQQQQGDDLTKSLNQQANEHYGNFGYGGPLNYLANGGELLTEYNGGGTHEQNPNGGIPVGQGNSVESGETQIDDYVFSDRLTVEELGKKAIKEAVKGKATFAKKSKKIKANFPQASSDKWQREAMKKELTTLRGQQEAKKNALKQQEQQATHAMPDGSVMPGASHGQLAYGGQFDEDSRVSQRLTPMAHHGGNPNLVTPLTQAQFDYAGGMGQGAVQGLGLDVKQQAIARGQDLRAERQRINFNNANQKQFTRGKRIIVDNNNNNNTFNSDYFRSQYGDGAVGSNIEHNFAYGGDKEAGTAEMLPWYLAQNMGNAYDIYRGAKGPDDVDFQRINIDPQSVDYSAAVRGVRNQADIGRAGLRNAVAGTGSRAGLTSMNIGNIGISGQAGSQIANIEQQQENTNKQFYNQAQQTNEQVNARIQMMEADARQRELDASRSAVSQGLHGLSTIAGMFGKDANRLGMENQMFNNGYTQAGAYNATRSGITFQGQTPDGRSVLTDQQGNIIKYLD